MLSVLSDSQKAIVEAMTMRLHVRDALQYLEQHGYPMSQAKYYRHKKKIEEMKLERMHYIAKYFPDQHLERIDRCELIEKLMWENYHQCKDQAKKVKILESIANLQPYLSSYYEATKIVLESTVRGRGEQQTQTQQQPSYEVPPIGDEPIVGYETEPWAIDDNKPKPKASQKSDEGMRVDEQILQSNSTISEDGWKQLQCPNCKKYFYNNFTLSAHTCNPGPIV
jgi:hypothetical protein